MGEGVGPDDDLQDLSDEALRQLADAYDRRRPGAPVASVGVRPRRRPWTYRDIWRADAIAAELAKRGRSPEAPR